jgi:hypothetical protein
MFDKIKKKWYLKINTSNAIIQIQLLMSAEILIQLKEHLDLTYYSSSW